MSEARWQNENILQASYLTGWSVLRNTVDYKKIATVNHNFFSITCLICFNSNIMFILHATWKGQYSQTCNGQIVFFRNFGSLKHIWTVKMLAQIMLILLLLYYWHMTWLLTYMRKTDFVPLIF